VIVNKYRTVTLAVRTRLRAGLDPAQCAFTAERCVAVSLSGDPLFKDGGAPVFDSCLSPISNGGFWCVNAGIKAGMRHERDFVCTNC
jgi:hypothetical protein